MKFLCPNCNAKYRIGSEKLVGRQAAKIRCRKCDYRIQIAYRDDGSDEYEVTASPTSLAPAAPPRAPKPLPAPVPPPIVGAPRVRSDKEEAPAGKRPTAAVPGLPGLGAPRSARGAAVAAAEAIPAPAPVRRPVPPPAPVPMALGSSATAQQPSAAAAPQAAPAQALAPAPAPAPVRPAAAGTQLADQFKQSVQAGGAVEEGPQDGWFVGVNGVPVGPIPVGDLRELVVAGHVDRRSLVWREGQAEWRPLGKFPHLARLLDESGASSAAQPNPEPAPEPPPAPAAPPTRANGHAGGAFAAASSAETQEERPSAWGDLDEEEDEDEQPTTVKGRVSVAPPAAQGTPAGDAPPPPAPPPGGLTSTGAIPVAALGGASALSAPPPEGPASTISTTPEPLVDEADASMMRPKRRGPLYAVLAVAAAFVLGAILMHVFGSSAPSDTPKAEPSREPARALAQTAEAETARAQTAPPKETLEEPAPAPPSMEPEASPAEPSPLPGPTAAGTYPVTRPVSGQLAPTQVPDVQSPAPPKPAGGLLSGLGGPQTPGPGGAARSGDSQGGGPGLDSTAIQRTVRRYSPAVRQNCWQRALNARAPGTPSSAKVTAQITVEASGRVQSVSVSGAPRGYPGLARCIETSVKGWTFPRGAGETITNVPFMFVGQ